MSADGDTDIDQISDPGEYKQRKLYQRVFDHQDRVLDQRAKALDLFYQGQIGENTRDTILREAVSGYILLSKHDILESEHGQYFWHGEPPTEDGRAPDFWEDGALPDEFEPAEIDTDDTNLITDDDGHPPFGIQPNVLGRIPIPEKNRVWRVVGLEGYMKFPDPLTVEFEEEERHPTRIHQYVEKTTQYQIPLKISLAAFDAVNQFWAQNGIRFDREEGLPSHEEFDTTTAGNGTGQFGRRSDRGPSI